MFSFLLAGHMVDSCRIRSGICQHVCQAVEAVENLSEQRHAEKSKGFCVYYHVIMPSNDFHACL